MVTIQLDKVNLDTIDTVSEISNFTSIQLYQISSKSDDIMSYIDDSQTSEDIVRIEKNNSEKIEKGQVVGAPCCFIPELSVLCTTLCAIFTPILAAITGVFGSACAVITPILGTLGTCIVGFLGSICAILTPVIGTLGACLVGLLGALGALLTPILACAAAAIAAIAPIGIALIGCVVAFIPVIGTILAIVLPIVLSSNSSNSG